MWVFFQEYFFEETGSAIFFLVHCIWPSNVCNVCSSNCLCLKSPMHWIQTAQVPILC